MLALGDDQGPVISCPGSRTGMSAVISHTVSIRRMACSRESVCAWISGRTEGLRSTKDLVLNIRKLPSMQAGI